MCPHSHDLESNVISKLNEIIEFELSGVTRYLHYSFMVFGPNRIPITSWLRSQADEGLVHATAAGEWVTALGAHPSVRVREVPEAHKHEIKAMLTEALEFEREGLGKYVNLLNQVKDQMIALEEWTRGQIKSEQDHIFQIEKMLRT